MWLYVGLGVSIGIWIVLGIYVFSEIKKTCNKKGIFTNKLLNSGNIDCRTVSIRRTVNLLLFFRDTVKVTITGIG